MLKTYIINSDPIWNRDLDPGISSWLSNQPSPSLSISRSRVLPRPWSSRDFSMSESPQEPKPSSSVVFLSGTHVTGKETLAVSLSKTLGCPWLKAETILDSADFGARSRAKKGYDYSEVFGRICVSKMRRIGFLCLTERYLVGNQRAKFLRCWERIVWRLSLPMRCASQLETPFGRLC